jgi:hypothetical protein
MFRPIILILLLAPLAWWLNREQGDGRFQRIDELFLDFLVANSREKLTTPDPAASKDEVLLIRLDPAERAEYSAWPPNPIDWQMILKGLRSAESAVVVVPEPLQWGKPPPDFMPALAEAMVPLPSLVLGVEAEPTDAPDVSAFTGGLENVIPRFLKSGGDVQLAPAFSALIAAPDETLRRYGELGLITKESVPYVLRDNTALMPGVLAQALARHTGTPYATHRVLLGPGGGAYLHAGFYVPLANDGSFTADPATKVSTISAIDFLSGGLADAVSAEDKQRIKNARIIVIGTDDRQQPGVARSHAQALTAILALPRIQKLAEFEQWIVWGIVALAGAWLVMRSPRKKAPHPRLLAHVRHRCDRLPLFSDDPAVVPAHDPRRPAGRLIDHREFHRQASFAALSS